jgi:hypothetical protein
MLDGSRAADQVVRLICVVLSQEGSPECIVCAYEEYGDEDHVELCEELVDELKPFLHTGERLRVATFDVDLGKAETFKFPSKKMWMDRENNKECARAAWIRYGQLHEVRGLVTVIVTWLVENDGRRRVFTWDVDHGDGAAMYEGVLDTIEGVKWNKLLAKKERLEPVAYKVPMSALRETDPSKDLHDGAVAVLAKAGRGPANG